MQLTQRMVMPGWRVFWVPQEHVGGGVRRAVLDGWGDLQEREEAAGVRAGDPIFLSPDHRVDPLLGAYVRSRTFRRYTAETKRNYATDLSLLLTFLWRRGRGWAAARSRDLTDFEDWRRFAEANPKRIGGSKWDREQAAFYSLYKWAKDNGHVTSIPVSTVQSRDYHGSLVTTPTRSKDARPANVHWLTPRTWRRWIDVGLRGHTAAGVVESGWAGRTEDRNVAFVRLLVSSGLRRAEGGALLTFEVPQRRLEGGRYYRGQVAAQVTRGKRMRTFYVASEAVGEVEVYVESSRALAVRQAQRLGRYEHLAGMRLVDEVTRGLKPKVRWHDRLGVEGERELNLLTAGERALLFTEGRRGPEPLWLWLNEQGLPLGVHSWDGVFREANQRCARVLTPPSRLGMDPHRVFAPYATPHSARHSFALYMLVVLERLTDLRYGLSPEERRDFRLLYGDPWFLVQTLLGHASRDTTVRHYLAPVADLQLRSMLDAIDVPARAPMPELDDTFARIARESAGIQDFGDEITPPGAGA
ncbi:integrase [Actinoplanes sp. L3-i22]|uniref:integrase n=1 Tax=Actinoplanes sp. L3-i22 TaxID=2836373 RepID=UPI00210263AE|nr:integrase [Actinoplanes sp. L3-i22]